MAVYSKLLLSAGGGIVSLQQQAEQERNTATVLIGLGGTGVECLRTIKTQVYARLQPDDPDAIIPAYEHIRFLGVDADKKSRGIVGSEEEGRADSLLALDDTEFFGIGNAHVKRDLANKQALRDRKELNWLRHEDIQAGDLSMAGAGGIRQVGRYMLMDKSDLFLSRLEREINAAKSGLVNPTVNVHIFSGLSGGTGSGTFLDVCYMVRSVAERLGGVTLFGYFFLPDVNLSRIPYENTKVRAYIPRNGYAAMQELDYCMQLQHNGGAFEQTYQGHRKIAWKEAPVDLCHLVCATNGNVVDNAYSNAMNVTAEYLMDFLTQSEGFDLSSQLSNFRSDVGIADGQKLYGMNVSYCAIGASCASLPLREINTYIAAELFDRFSRINTNVPTQGDVESLAVGAFGRSQQMGVGQLYDSLLSELREGCDSSYAPYPDDWKFVQDYGNKELVNHYTNQTAKKMNAVETAARSLQDENNQDSLIGRLRTALSDMIRDINHGPICAHRTLSAAESHNLLNIINGLIEENEARRGQEAYQSESRERDYEGARRDFDQRPRRMLFDNGQKLFKSYEYYLMVLEQHKFELYCYQRLDEVLRTLYKQVEDMDDQYYRRLARVVTTLSNTFRENRDALANERVTPSTDKFFKPLMTVAELKGPMDKEIESLNIEGMLSSLMGLLLDNDEEWLQEDENKITKLVTKFFVEEAFGNFAGRSITAFLKDKYGTDNDEDLTNRVYRDWMTVLTEEARPLFYFNGTIWREDQTEKLAFLSVPTTSAPIQRAAERMNSIDQMWRVKKSTLTDRIYVMSSAAALPLAAYNNCDEYERKYFSISNSSGTHYYEGKPIPGMRFDDWRKLPPLTPQSLVHMNSVPDQVRAIVQEGRDLFAAALQEEIIDDEYYVLQPTEESLGQLRLAIEACQQFAEHMDRPDKLSQANELLERLADAQHLDMERTDAHFPKDGYAETEEYRRRVLEDHFVSAPAHQMLVRDILERIAEVHAEATKVEQMLREGIEAVAVGGKHVTDYCDALFTGVISLEGRTVVYHRTEHGIVSDIVLSKRGSEFSFGSIPLYQGFVTYKALDAEDQKQIRAEVEQRYNDDDAKIEETGTKLREVITEDHINAWAQLANNFAERADVIEFIEELHDRFGTFCMENGI